MRPVAEVEYPPMKGSEKPITMRYDLTKVCCGSCFYAPIGVPDDAAEGKAKVTLSFDAWKEGKVKASMVDLPVAVRNTPKQRDPLPIKRD
jgi:hypothetical protein